MIVFDEVRKPQSFGQFKDLMDLPYEQSFFATKKLFFSLLYYQIKVSSQGLIDFRFQINFMTHVHEIFSRNHIPQFSPTVAEMLTRASSYIRQNFSLNLSMRFKLFRPQVYPGMILWDTISQPSFAYHSFKEFMLRSTVYVLQCQQIQICFIFRK